MANVYTVLSRDTVGCSARASRTFDHVVAARTYGSRLKRLHPTWQIVVARYALRLDPATGATVYTPEPVGEVKLSRLERLRGGR